MDYFEEIAKEFDDDAPCGENLEDDAGFSNFFFEAEGTPEKFDGQNTIPAEAPDWRDIKKRAQEHLVTTKDLKLISVLAQAVLNTEGLNKFEECLRGVRFLVNEQWQNVFPPLDEDDGDPLERISALSLITEKNFVLNSLKSLPLGKSKMMGLVCLSDIEKLTDSSREKQDSDINETQISAIFKDTDPEELGILVQAINDCKEHIEDINQTFIGNAGNSYSVDFDKLAKILGQMTSAIGNYAEIEQADDNEEEINEENSGEAGVSGSQSKAQTIKICDVTLNSREDIEKSIDLICDYYAKYEPSSPLPLLLKRARKLVHLEFLDIIKEIASDATDQIINLGGIEEEDEY